MLYAPAVVTDMLRICVGRFVQSLISKARRPPEGKRWRGLAYERPQRRKNGPAKGREFKNREKQKREADGGGGDEMCIKSRGMINKEG